MVQSSLYDYKNTFGRISKSPKLNQFEEIARAEKKKIGPNHYKNVEAGQRLIEDRTGRYNGLSKTSTDMLLLVQHQKAMAKEVPQVGHYSPNHRLTEERTKIANLNRDKSPQRGVFKVDKKSPGPQTYQVDKKDERKIISIKKKSITFSIGSPDRNNNTKLDRFIDIHKK